MLGSEGPSFTVPSLHFEIVRGAGAIRAGAARINLLPSPDLLVLSSETTIRGERLASVKSRERKKERERESRNHRGGR